jgi:hypothetical protein
VLLHLPGHRIKRHTEVCILFFVCIMRRPLTRSWQESLPAVSESEGEDEENAEQGTRDVEMGRRERAAPHNGRTEPSCTGRGMRQKKRKNYDVYSK